jgi:hypothetical protein
MVIHRTVAAACVLFAGGAAAQSSYQILACVVAQLEGNPAYFGAATGATKLRCEIDNPNIYPTLAELYAEGWRLIEVLGDDHAIAMGNRGPSPLYLLERAAPDAVPAQEGAEPVSNSGAKE